MEGDDYPARQAWLAARVREIAPEWQLGLGDPYKPNGTRASTVGIAPLLLSGHHYEHLAPGDYFPALRRPQHLRPPRCELRPRSGLRDTPTQRESDESDGRAKS